MNDSIDQRAAELFKATIDRDAANRTAFLDDACGIGTPLRAQVELLLRADQARGGFLGATVAAPALTAGEREGSRIGAYKLLQRIGEGGFGSVFMAEQQTPVVRKVALKLIKLGMDTRQVIARFEAERQALAMMDHPNIARVLDAGATESGRPYFVMELVKGVPITEYCDSNNLTIAERLTLFGQVCHAVQHAHQKGVIHRDIKPNNVLVSTQDRAPHAKIIDFGIAKATAARLTEKTLFTEHHQLIGTPQYMSPEQAEGSLDIDTRTDVYALDACPAILRNWEWRWLDARSDMSLVVLRGHDSSVNAVSFSPDGTRIVSASGDRTARVWDVVTGRQTVVLRGHERSVTAASF